MTDATTKDMRDPMNQELDDLRAERVALTERNEQLKDILSSIIGLADSVSRLIGPKTNCYNDNCVFCQLDRAVEDAKELVNDRADKMCRYKL